MRRLAASIVAVTTILIFGPAALADWDHPVKVDQLDPDPGNWSIVSYIGGGASRLAADDFQCTETGYITDIEFDGWADFGVASVEALRITFWSDVPATADEESHPGEQPLATIAVAAADPNDPLGLGWQQLDDHLYKINLPEQDWFRQEEGTIYWIGIQGIMADMSSFYWMLRSRYAENSNHDAVYSETGAAPWSHQGWPDASSTGTPDVYEGKLPDDWDKSADMSFRLTGIAIPEPATIGLVALAGLALALRRKR